MKRGACRYGIQIRQPTMDLVWWVSRYILGIYALLLVSSLILVFLFRFHYSRNLQERSQRRHRVLGFYHPYCSGGGGGERVLWKMIQVIGDLVEKGSSLQVVIYTIDAPSPSYEQDVLDKVQERFDLTISSQIRLKFVHLDKYKHWLEPSPRFSMLVESYGTVRLACAGLQQELPDWWIDTTGAAFTFLPAWALGCQIAAYVHYPTISTDMLGVVWKQPGWKAKVKLIYYRLFAALYGLTGFLANCVMVNSTWTANHIRSIWFCSPRIVYPPCRELIPAKLDKKEPFILSIGQFRPEKDHKLQLEAMKLLLQEHPEYRQSAKLVVLGSCRNEADQSRLEDLRCLAKTLAIDDCVQFVVNEPYSVLQEWLLKSKVGIHTVS